MHSKSEVMVCVYVLTTLESTTLCDWSTLCLILSEAETRHSMSEVTVTDVLLFDVSSANVSANVCQ